LSRWFHVEKAWLSTGPVTARVGEQLWKALYVEDAGPVTARVGEQLWKALYVEDAFEIVIFSQAMDFIGTCSMFVDITWLSSTLMIPKLIPDSTARMNISPRGRKRNQSK
jgi:hypothetical protein